MINFLKHTRLYATISIIVVLVGIWGMLVGGIKPGIDFTGGSVIEYQADKIIDANQVKNTVLDLASKMTEVKEISVKDKNILLTLKSLDEKQEVELRGMIEKTLSVQLTSLRFDSVGATLGAELLQKTLFASFIAILGILLYITYAFKKLSYGLAAIGAMVHDLVVLVGTYALVVKFFGGEIDALFVTALLTTLSFSVHDTIVVFDKIREMRRRGYGTSLADTANKALTETMVRSLNNSLTIVFMLVILVIMGGDTTRYFAVALLIGTITGTYSSPFIATPLLVYLESRKK